VPAERQAQSADDDQLQRLDGEDGDPLGAEQAAAAEGAHPEQPEHAVPAVEARGDGLGGERGGDDAQGEDAGHGQVDPAAGAEAGGGGHRQAEQGRAGQHERHQQLLAVAQQRAGLEPGLGGDPAGGRCGRAHRAPSRVSAK
jgi:hypothetical protein